MALSEELVDWLYSVIAAVPTNLGLVYIEWNTGQRNEEEVVFFHAFGFDCSDFHPEDPDSLDVLENWDWEFGTSCVLPRNDQDVDAYDKKLKQFLKKRPTQLAAFSDRGGQLAFGLHESDVSLFPPLKPRKSTDYFYELGPAYASNTVIVEGDGLDLDIDLLHRVVSQERLEYSIPKDAVFLLQKRGKLLDLLNTSRWFICSDRLRKLIQSATNHCQVFPIPLYRSLKVDPKNLVSGYFIVHLYEKLDCLDPRDVVPSKYEGMLPKFDCSKGYRILTSVVQDRDIFRINYEYRRLVVSQRFRDRCEQIGFTGATWLRRTAI